MLNSDPLKVDTVLVVTYTLSGSMGIDRGQMGRCCPFNS